MSRKIIRGLVVPNERDREMHEYLFRGGHTLQECGDKYGITRERVRQLMDMCYGETNKHNDSKWARSAIAIYNKKKDKEEKYRKRRELVIYKYFGCHEEIVTNINGERFSWNKEGMKSLAGEYVRQRRSSARRGIPWLLNFREWWSIWEKSGKYNDRGRKKGQYVMSRCGDIGPYSKDNIEIKLAVDNIKEYYTNNSKEEISRRRRAGHERNLLQLQATA